MSGTCRVAEHLEQKEVDKEIMLIQSQLSQKEQDFIVKTAFARPDEARGGCSLASPGRFLALS